MLLVLSFFFFKQKTAYEIRPRDWSSDVCSSDLQFYSHLLPSLETRSWKSNRVAGEGWMAVGDAAGLVDPITGEGLYYAIRSGDLAAKSLLAEVGGLSERIAHYRKAL